MDSSALDIILTDALGTETVQAEGVDYTVTIGVSDGTVLMTTPPAVGEKLTIVLNQPLTQQTDYETEGEFDLDEVENDLDRSTLRDLTLKEELRSSFKVPSSDPYPQDLPPAETRADKFAYYNAQR